MYPLPLEAFACLEVWPLGHDGSVLLSVLSRSFSWVWPGLSVTAVWRRAWARLTGHSKPWPKWCMGVTKPLGVFGFSPRSSQAKCSFVTRPMSLTLEQSKPWDAEVWSAERIMHSGLGLFLTKWSHCKMLQSSSLIRKSLSRDEEGLHCKFVE
jgi:hypothetical protein